MWTTAIYGRVQAAPHPRQHFVITGFCLVFWLPQGLSVKNPPAVQESREMQFQCLGGEDPLEEGMATHSSILAWRIPWTEELLRLQSIELQRVRDD